MTTPAFDSLWGSDPPPRAAHGFAGRLPALATPWEDQPALSSFDEAWDAPEAPAAPIAPQVAADFGDVTGGASSTRRDPLAILQGSPENMAAFGHGIAKTAFLAPFEMARAAIGTVFGNPTQEELDNPLVRASIINRMGRMPDIQPRPEGAPGPIAEAYGQVKGLVTMPYDAMKEVAALPPPVTAEDFEHRGELAGGAILGIEGLRHGGRSVLEAYKKRLAARAAAAPPPAPAPVLEPPAEVVARETFATAPPEVMVEEPTPWAPPEPVAAPPAVDPIARRAELEAKRPPDLTPEEVQELLQLRQAQETMPAVEGVGEPPSEIARVRQRIQELEAKQGDILSDPAHELAYWRQYLDDLEQGRARERTPLDDAMGTMADVQEGRVVPPPPEIVDQIPHAGVEPGQPGAEMWDTGRPAPKPPAESAPTPRTFDQAWEGEAAPPPPVELTAAKHELGAAVSGPAGAETQVMVHDGQAYPARYRVVEADALRSSHDPHTFAPTEGYPRGIQGRDYQRNAAAQETVRARALDFNADMALNPSRSATEGQPTILPDGTVLAGNERSMHPRIAAELAPEKYAAYRQALEERAATFGLDAGEIRGMQRPVLVRELTSITEIHGGPKAWAEFNRKSDVTATKAKSQVEEGRARAMTLAGSTDALRHLAETIGAEETVSQYLGTAHGRTFVKQLLDSGVITKEELGRFTSGEGTLTQEGRDAIRQMLLSTAVHEPAVLIDAPPQVVAKLEHAVPNIVALRGTAYDPSRLVTAGLRALGDARAQGLTLRDYGGQGDLLGREASRAQSPLALEFAAYLENNSKMAVATAFRRYATLAREAIAAGTSVDMFGGTGWTPATAFREAFGLQQEFKAAMASRGKRPRADAPGLFGEEDLGGFFSESGAAGPVGSRPAGTEPPRPIADALQQRQGAPAPSTADLLTSQGKYSADEIAARPEAIQSEELGGITEYAPGQKDLFARGMGARGRRVPAEASEGGPIVQALRERAAGTPDGVERTPEGTPLPDPGQVVDRTMPSLKELRDSIQALVAADTVSPGAGDTAGTVRWKNASRAHDVAKAEHQLRSASRYAADLPRAEQFALDDAIETGKVLEDPRQAELAGMFRELLDTEAQKIQRLGTGKLQQMIEHYLPHIWTDPEAAAAVIGSMGAKRPLEGSKSFLKKRTIATMRDGLEAGLIPVTYNPIELALLKYREMRRYRMAVEIMKHEKRARRLEFVPSDQTPRPGLKRIEDPAFSVFGPPSVPIAEGFDAGVREGLNAFIASMPELRHKRAPKIGMQGALGYAVGPAGKFMATKFGTESVVIMHELGHILDFRYGLWDRLIEPAPKEAYTYKRGKKAGQTVQRTAKQDAAVVAERKQMKQELRALADLRWEGQEPSGYYKQYVRDRYEQVANAVHALIYAPEKMQAVAPGIRSKLIRFLKGDPKLAKLLEIKPSLRVGAAMAEQPLPGFPLLGHYYAEAPVARVLNNFLSPGLRGKAIYDAYMGVGNTLNQAQLGLSAFHVGFTSFDVATSKIALSIEQLRAGRPIAAAKSFAAAPAAPITTALKGLRVRKEYLTPGGAPEMAGVVKALDQAGGRVLQDERYSTGSWKRLMDAIHERKPMKGAANLLPGLIELAAAPIFEHIVPAQKLGVFADLAQFEMSKMSKDTTPTEARRALGRVWESVDNRLGMMVYDNLFWHKTFKDILHASVRAVGWNVGTVRELGGGLYDLQKLRRGELTHRAAYVVALPIMAGMAGAVITYLYTGQGPQTLKDYFYPPTGKQNKDGNVERIQLPSYLKDLVSFARHPVTTVSHKVHPLIGVLGDMLSNEDFFGNQIRNPHDPLVQQLQQEAKYLLEAVEPLGIRNARDTRDGQTTTTKALNFIGITPAPREMVRTPAQNRMSEVMASRGHGGGTPEDVEARDRRRDVGSAYRTGEIGVEQLTDSMHAGVLSRGQRNDLMRHTEAPYVRRFKQLSWADAEDVYRRAIPSERAAWWPLLVRKRVLALRQLSQAGIQDARTQQLLESLRSGISLDRPGEPLTVSAP